jgi:hypothetical protein
VLVIFAAAAACTARDDSQGTEILSQDRTLAAQLKTDQESRAQRLPDACGVVKLAAQPADANQRQADDLTRKAQDAEMHGDIREARSLLRRAADLDGTNKSTAYHLGRTSEALGDRDAAMTAYCRYLALTPTSAESAEARQRVTVLSQSQSQISTSAGSVSDSVPTPRPAVAATVRRVTRERSTTQPRVVASAKAEKPVRSARAPERSTTSTSTEVGVVEQSATAIEPVTSSPDVGSATESKPVEGDVVATSSRTPNVEQPSTAPRSQSRGPNRAQNAGIGAAAGGLIGAITGRSVKSAVMGAAAGGLLGAVMPGRSTSPMGRGIVPYARQ